MDLQVFTIKKNAKKINDIQEHIASCQQKIYLAAINELFKKSDERLTNDWQARSSNHIHLD